MTPLRQRMLEDMQLGGRAARTQESYPGAVRRPCLLLPARSVASPCVSFSTFNPGHAVRRERAEKRMRLCLMRRTRAQGLATGVATRPRPAPTV